MEHFRPGWSKSVEATAAISPAETKSLQQAVDMLEKVNDPSARAAQNVIKGIIGNVP